MAEPGDNIAFRVSTVILSVVFAVKALLELVFYIPRSITTTIVDIGRNIQSGLHWRGELLGTRRTAVPDGGIVIDNDKPTPTTTPTNDYSTLKECNYHVVIRAAIPCVCHGEDQLLQCLYGSYDHHVVSYDNAHDAIARFDDEYIQGNVTCTKVPTSNEALVRQWVNDLVEERLSQVVDDRLNIPGIHLWIDQMVRQKLSELVPVNTRILRLWVEEYVSYHMRVSPASAPSSPPLSPLGTILETEEFFEVPPIDIFVEDASDDDNVSVYSNFQDSDTASDGYDTDDTDTFDFVSLDTDASDTAPTLLVDEPAPVSPFGVPNKIEEVEILA